MFDIKKKFENCTNKNKHLMKLLRIIRSALAVSLLSISVAGCGTFAELVEAPQPIVKLKYQNPPKPTPLLPFNPTIKTLEEWVDQIDEGLINPYSLVCMTNNDSLDLMVWMKGVSRWEREALHVIQFHEDQN